ncbi:hypothetical protein COPG_00115 [Colwellia phage 9A]|uniref:Uncharacterized protein n=1 Tax=Colwellia phage 9A TaxID=765765 RepID=I3UMJ6_9CAUD|nr:hypothetical protein COPG_00115 [Colwellia phage 9A]AFK66711.1 hypothetical protein COPG_00115 [Colwellia phage 9A]
MKTSELNLNIYNRPLKDGHSYLARVVGIAFLGHRLSPDFRGMPRRLRPEILFSFEFLDEETYISSKKPLVMHQVMAATPHPMGRFHKLANAIDKTSITSYTEDVPSESSKENEDELGQCTVYEINTPQLVYGLVSITVRESNKHEGHFSLSKIEEPTYHEKKFAYVDTCPIQTPYIYDLTTDNLIQGNREDMPSTILKWALDTMQVQ